MKKAELELLQVVRCFQRHSHETRADMASSHRLGYRQRRRVGEFFWVTGLVPGLAFDSRGRAVAAARKALAEKASEQKQSEEALASVA